MAFTGNSDLFGSINEEGINRAVRGIGDPSRDFINRITLPTNDDDTTVNAPGVTGKPANNAETNALYEFEDPYPILAASGGLIPVKLPIRDLAITVNDVEMVLEANVGA